MKKCILCKHSVLVRGSLRCRYNPPCIPGKEFAEYPTVKSDGTCAHFSLHFVTYAALWLITRRRHKAVAIERPKAFNIGLSTDKNKLFVATERESGRRYYYTLYGWVLEDCK